MIKHFNELTTTELYELLRLRSEVFVVEQDCVYQDLDYNDQNAMHVVRFEGDKAVGCLRVFIKEGETAQIGRVVVAQSRRGTHLAYDMMQEALEIARERLCASKAYLEAQCYAIGFYEKSGFKVVSEPFLEDGIPHVKMERYL